MSVRTNEGRFYRRPGSDILVPSITNVIGMKAKPGIAYWGYRKIGEFVADNLTAINLLGEDRTAIIDLVRGAPARATDKSSNRGDLVHGWIDLRVRTNGEHPTDAEITEEAQGDKGAIGMWRAFLAVERAYEIKWLHSETTIWSDEYQYAGTIDWMAEVMGILTLGDTKTGNNVYPEVAMQVAAAAHADYAFDDDGHKFKLPVPERFAALHLRPTFGRLHPLENIDEAFASFLGLRATFEWDTEVAEQTIRYSPKIEVR
jgi:hypothetical protein